MQDEGIVQPVSKEMDALSRRLHQCLSDLAGSERRLLSRNDMRYRIVRSLPPVDAAYLGGLIDGEGTVTLSRRHANERRQLVVRIANTDRALLEYALRVMGAGKITSKRIASERHTPSFCFTVTNRQALEMLRQIEPFLRTYKKQRTTLALTHYVRVTPRNGKYSPALNVERLNFERRFMNLTGKVQS
jgi:LAGLIDADG-like domain